MPSLFRRRAVTTAACTVLVLAPASAAPALAVETAAAARGPAAARPRRVFGPRRVMG